MRIAALALVWAIVMVSATEFARREAEELGLHLTAIFALAAVVIVAVIFILPMLRARSSRRKRDGKMKIVLNVLLLAVLVAIFLPCAFAQDSSTHGEDELLQVLIEKAKEREELFDNVEAMYSYENFGSENWAARLLKCHWARSGSRRLIEIEPADPSTYYDADGDQKRAYTDETRKTLFGASSNKPTAYLDGHTRDAGPILTRYFAPEQFGVTAVAMHGSSALKSLRGFLEAGTSPPEERYKYSTRLLGEMSVAGRDLIVVERITLYPSRSADSDAPVQYVERLFFDKRFNYNCVAAEAGKMVEGKYEVGRHVRMDDFREVKPGLFVPFFCSFDMPSKGGEWKRLYEYRIEDIQFRDGFEDSFFDVEFPLGTRVHDDIVSIKYTVGGMLQSAVDIDDVLFEAEETEAGIEEAPADQSAIPAADPGEPEPAVAEDEEEPSGHRFVSGLVRAGIVVVLLSVLAFLFLKRRKRGWPR